MKLQIVNGFQVFMQKYSAALLVYAIFDEIRLRWIVWLVIFVT